MSSRNQTGVAVCAAVGVALKIASSDMIDTMKGGGPCGFDGMWFVGF